MAFLTVHNLNKNNDGEIVLSNIQLKLNKAEKLAIAGETGSGKTSLLKMIGGLEQPDAGDIYFEGTRVKGALEQLIPGHPGIAYLSQDFDLPHNYYVHEVLSYSNEFTEEKATELYDICHISHLLKRRTNQLSGGEKQRIALARLLGSMPRLLLLDEPFSNFDAIHKKTMRTILDEISKRLDISIIMVSHDALDILSWADRIIILKDGKMIQEGTNRDVYLQPTNEYCAALLGDFSLLTTDDSNQTGKKLFIRPGYIHLKPGNDAEVIHTVYFGSYVLVSMLYQNQVIKAFSTNMNLVAGNKTSFDITGPKWYL